MSQTPANEVQPGAIGQIDALPILLLHVHEHCNCRCLMCDIWQKTDGRELDVADFERHRASLLGLGVREVVLTGGEALLHRGFDQLCSFLHQCGARVTLLTTGLLLSKRAAAVAAGVDEVIVSIDGPEHIHDQVRRVNGAYRLIARGIEDVRRAKANMPFFARCTVQKTNHNQIRQTVAGVKSIGFDSISFLAADLTSQAFNRESVWPILRQNEIALSPNEVSALESEVEALIAEFAPDFERKYIVESPAKMRRIVRRFKEHLGIVPPVAPRCNAPWVSAVVEVDGTVRPCFFHAPIGNLNGHTLEDVLNSDSARSFRASLDVEENPVCRRCVCSLNYRPDANPAEQAT